MTKKALILFIIFFFSKYIQLFAQPAAPIIKYISQDPFTEEITIAWYASTSANISSLFVEELRPGKTDEAWPNQLYTGSNISDSKTIGIGYINKQPARLAVNVKINGCSTNNCTSTGLSNFHCPAVIKEIKQSYCPDKSEITWADYIGASATINSYTIYKIEGNQGVAIQTVAPNAEKKIIYPVNTIGKQNLCFYVETTLTDPNGATWKSTSAKNCGDVIVKRYPKYIRANSATTLDSNKIQLSFTLDTACDFKHYRLYAADSINGDFQPVQGADFPQINSPSLTYIDSTVNTMQQRRFYKLYLIGNCGDTPMYSNIASNIVLRVREADRLENELTWDAYHDFMQGVETYHIYRTIDKGNAQLLDNYMRTGKELLNYYDNTEDDVQQGAEFCYYIVSQENKGTFSPAISTSNRVCIQRKDRVFIPEAINPYSKVDQNKTFKPSLAFVTNENYELRIVDRWGKLVFKTNETQQAWDGKINNEIAPPGTYVYNLKYQTSTGKEEIKKGTFNVIY